MSAADWDSIAPLIAATTFSASDVLVTFRCPVSGFSADSRAPLGLSVAPSRESSKGRLGRWLSNIFGRKHSSASDDRIVAAETISEPLQHAAVMAAFSRVANRFARDPRTRALVAAFVVAELESDFSRILGAAPFDTKDLRQLLARVLAAIAVVDGQIDDIERTFFDSFTGSDPAFALDAMLALPSLSAVDFDGLGDAHRLSLQVLASAMVLADEIHDPGERMELMRLAGHLGLDDGQRTHAFDTARDQLVEDALMTVLADGVVSGPEHDALGGLAVRLGIPHDRYLGLDSRCRKRLGLAT